MSLVKVILYLLTKILKFGLYIVLSVVISISTIPFLLGSLLVLRLSQFIKQGEDYDQASQVRSVVEWFIIICGVALALAIFLFHIMIPGNYLLARGSIISLKVVAVLGVRFILLWFIQKYMPRMTLKHNESRLKVIQAISDIVDCLSLWYLRIVMMNYLTLQKILGLPAQNWIDVTIFIVIGWNIIALSTHLIAWSIHKLVSRYLNHFANTKERSHRYLLLERLLSVHCLVYYGNGIKRSINFMLSSLLLLLVWVLYFSSHLTKTDSNKAKIVRDYGTWTCTVLLILSFLWILKDCVLLSWEANAVYYRLSSDILEYRKSLYFLGMIGRHSHDILRIRYEVREKHSEINARNRVQMFMAKNLARVDAYYQDNRDEDDNDEMESDSGGNRSQLKPKLSNRKSARVKHDLLLLKDDTMTLFDIQQVAQYFVPAGNSLLKETYTSDILSKLNLHSDIRDILKKLISGKKNVSDVVQRSTESILLPMVQKCLPSFAMRLFKKILPFHPGDGISETEEVQDWKYFEELLNLNSSSDGCDGKVKTWLEKSHNKCLFLANTLRSAKEVVDCLNNIISVLLISASLLLWFIFAGLTNKETLILIASPFLAATFIFGDTCKSLFQGIIFVYVVHPFDVGDLCVIDEKMMEVKSIGVWKTTFSVVDKIGAHEDVIYPNIELMLKMVINLKTEFDWNDSIEFSAEHLDKQQIKKLVQHIEDHLDGKNNESKELVGKNNESKELVGKNNEPKPSSHSVAVLPAGKGVKIVVQFRHKHNVGMTYFECVKKKDSLRSLRISEVVNLANKVKEESKLAGLLLYFLDAILWSVT
ncbi:hypothetical protein KSS87_003889 [Heliosperma pusillum]|nr:hypothetical protein KSS87_003889 [Heliosperma pusillum]